MQCSKELTINVEPFLFSINLVNNWLVALDTPVSNLGSVSVDSGTLPPGIAVALDCFNFDNFHYGAVNLGGTPTSLGTFGCVLRVLNPFFGPDQLISVSISVEDVPLAGVTWSLAWGSATIGGSGYVAASAGGTSNTYNFETQLAAFTAASVSVGNRGVMLRSGRPTPNNNNISLLLSGLVGGLGSGGVSVTQYADAGFLYGVQQQSRSFGNPPVNATDVFRIYGGRAYIVVETLATMQQGAAVATASNYNGSGTLS